MLRKICLSTVAIVALTLSARASGAPPVFTWTGFYVGAHAGYGFGDAKFPLDADENHKFKGGIVGAQFGWNHQFTNNLVFGLEASYSGMDLTGSVIVDIAPPPFLVQTQGTKAHRLLMMGSRFGYAFDRTLLYVNGGYASMRFTGWFSDAGGTTRARNSRDGWFLGAGVEYALHRNWTVRAEYNYINFGTSEWSFGIPRPGKVELQRVTIGLNYLFNSGPPTALVAKY